MRTIYVTGGYSDALEVDPAAGFPLDGATFRLALLAEDVVDPPPADDPAWAAVAVQPGGEVRKLVTDEDPGHYHLWLQTRLAGVLVQPSLVLDEDGAPLLVRVV